MSGDDLTIILFLLGLCVTALISGMSLLERKRKLITISLFVLAGLFLLLGFGWLWLKPFSPKIAEHITQMASNPVAWFVIIMFLVALLLLSKFGDQKPRKEIEAASAANRDSALQHTDSIVQNINIVAGVTPQGSPVLLLADVKSADSRLRIFVEFSYQSRGHFGGPVWIKPRQVPIADIVDVIKGQQINVPIVTRKLSGEEIWWGGKDDAAGNLIQKFHKYRAQLKFIRSDNSEQIYRFFLFRTSVTEPPYVVEVFTEQELDLSSH